MGGSSLSSFDARIKLSPRHLVYNEERESRRAEVNRTSILVYNALCQTKRE